MGQAAPVRPIVSPLAVVAPAPAAPTVALPAQGEPPAATLTKLPVATPPRRSREVPVDLDGRAAAGYLVPGQSRTALAEQMRAGLQDLPARNIITLHEAFP